LATKGRSHELGQPPIDGLEHSFLLGVGDAGGGPAEMTAAAVANFDKDKSLTLSNDEVELADGAAKLLAQ
jgi:hypothetical protein